MLYFLINFINRERVQLFPFIVTIMKEQKDWTQEEWDAYYAFLADKQAEEEEQMVIDFLEMEADY